MYILFDTFNQREVSRHRGLRTLAHAEKKFLRAVRRCNGENSYLPTTIRRTDGNELSEAEWYEYYKVSID